LSAWFPRQCWGIFPADHVIADEAAFVATIRRAIQLAAAGDNIVVLGIEAHASGDGLRLHRNGRCLRRWRAARAAVLPRGDRDSRPEVRAEEFLLLSGRMTA